MAYSSGTGTAINVPEYNPSVMDTSIAFAASDAELKL